MRSNVDNLKCCFVREVAVTVICSGADSMGHGDTASKRIANKKQETDQTVLISRKLKRLVVLARTCALTFKVVSAPLDTLVSLSLQFACQHIRVLVRQTHVLAYCGKCGILSY